jgi:cation transport ATPase
MATDAAQVVLMDDDLGQLDALWQLAAGLTRSFEANERVAKAFSLGAAAGVLAVPLALKFWLVELGWFAQSLPGIRLATRQLDGGAARVRGDRADPD